MFKERTRAVVTARLPDTAPSKSPPPPRVKGGVRALDCSDRKRTQLGLTAEYCLSGDGVEMGGGESIRLGLRRTTRQPLTRNCHRAIGGTPLLYILG